jgi:tRNA A-37 threonylcarbamoyl transferase component Bud32
MSDLEDAVAEFLSEADTVYSEYEQGYMNADVALDRLEKQVEELRERAE